MSIEDAAAALFQRRLRAARSEEDVRVTTSEFLSSQLDGVTFSSLGGRHEVPSAHGGRADSVYQDVIFEYKAPRVLASKRGALEALEGRPESTDRGLKHYLVNFSLDEAVDDESFEALLLSKVGVGFDGSTFIFCRWKPDTATNELRVRGKTKAFPKGITSRRGLSFSYEVVTDFTVGLKKLMLFLRSTTRTRLSPHNLLSAFGPESDMCRRHVQYLYDLLESNVDSNPRVGTLFAEWHRIFGDIFGDIETDFTSYRDELRAAYGVDEDIDVRRMLFAVQTYYNLILKLLVHNLLSSLENPVVGTFRPTNRAELNRLFSGKHQEDRRVANFFEIHYFEWFIYATSFDQSVVGEIIAHLESFETTGSILRPEDTEDLFREMYEGLVPRGLRHLLGEYYTPGWLVDFVLDQADYHGQPELSVLDPCCGSGSFVVHAIKRFHAANQTLSGAERIAQVTQRIVGYDINPITAISAKTNYLLALGDLTEAEGQISIPIYMCDSVLVPTVHAKQNDATHSVEIDTVVGTFRVPVFKNRIESDRYLQEISRAVEHYSFEEFTDYIKVNNLVDLDGVNMDVARAFYEQIAELHLSSKDGYWGTILKDAFAPLFARGGFDVVVGNPPWIAWKSMSDTYRRQTLDIWLSYGIFEKSAYDKITTHDDFAMAVTYVAVDHYCRENGEVVFVLPQTFLKASKGGEGFRKFRITRDDLDTPFAVTCVYDMEEIKPFQGFASNRAAVLKFEKNREMRYPMNDYFKCVYSGSDRLRARDSLAAALAKIDFVRLSAKPVDADDVRSPWLTMSDSDLAHADSLLGGSAYRGRKGIEPCGAKGIYLLDVTDSKGNQVRIHNLIERSRLPKAKALGEHAGWVEAEHVYPMIGGRDIRKWGVCGYRYMLVPHYRSGEGVYRGIPESDLKVQYPKTYAWLLYFKELLYETRVRSGKFFDPRAHPFYRLDNVGPYTFMPYRVVWREQGRRMMACVLGQVNTEHLGGKIAVTDSKVLGCATTTAAEAHYLCAVINAPIISRLIEGYTIDTQRGVDILNNIRIPRFQPDNPLHLELSQTSQAAHDNYSRGAGTQALEAKLDELVESAFAEAFEAELENGSLLAAEDGFESD